MHPPPLLPVRLGPPNARVGGLYALAAGLVATLGWLTRPAGLLLLWPAGALGTVAAGYLRFGPGIYRKRAGRLPWAARWLLGPSLLGQYLSWRHYARRCQPWDEVVPGVLVGRQLREAEAIRAVREAGVSAVLDLTAEFSEAAPFLSINYRNLPLLDLSAPSPAQVRAAVTFIDEGTAAGGTVYVHCKAGYSRSAAVVGAWLLASGRAASVPAAIAMLRAARPSIVVRPEALVALETFALSLPCNSAQR